MTTHQKPSTCIIIDTTTFKLINKISAQIGDKPKKRILDELAAIALIVLDKERNGDQHYKLIDELLIKSKELYQFNDHEQQHNVAVNRQCHSTMRRLKTLYNISYNQLIQALALDYVKTFATSFTTSDRSTVISITAAMRAANPKVLDRCIKAMGERDNALLLHTLEVLAAAHPSHADTIESVRSLISNTVLHNGNTTTVDGDNYNFM